MSSIEGRVAPPGNPVSGVSSGDARSIAYCILPTAIFARQAEALEFLYLARVERGEKFLIKKFPSSALISNSAQEIFSVAQIYSC
jgi:hypothetical protein